MTADPLVHDARNAFTIPGAQGREEIRPSARSNERVPLSARTIP